MVIFPVPLPEAGALLPPGFDDTIPADFVPALDGELAETLNVLATQAQKLVEPLSIHVRPRSKPLDHTAFVRWRDEIARPVLSAIAHQLRGAGHQARVILRPLAGKEAEAVVLRSKMTATAGWPLTIEAQFSIGGSPDACRLETTPTGGDLDGKPMNRSVWPLESLDAKFIERVLLALLREGYENSPAI
jgi:hypothetical protein